MKANSQLHGSLVLPVAPRHFIGRKVSNKDVVITPNQVELLCTTQDQVQVIVLEGPGDPLATPKITKKVISLIQKRWPETDIQITTSGINSTAFLEAEHIAQINLVVDALDPSVLKSIYNWIRPAQKNIPLTEACLLLLEEQEKLLVFCKEQSIPFIAQTTIVPENVEHILNIAKKMADYGALSLQLSKSSEVEDCALEALQKQTAMYLPTNIAKVKKIEKSPELVPTETKDKVAVTTSDGLNIDQHLGQAKQVVIYANTKGTFHFVGKRQMPEPGKGDQRWQELAATLNDCYVLLTSHAGPKATENLEQLSLPIIIHTGRIETHLNQLHTKKG